MVSTAQHKAIKEGNDMRYRIKFINTKTEETFVSTLGFSSKKSAIEWAEKWRAQGEPFDCQILDTKNGFKVVG